MSHRREVREGPEDHVGAEEGGGGDAGTSSAPAARVPDHTTVVEQGQITIPAWIRDALNLRPGDRIEMLMRGDDLGVIRPRTVLVNPGILRPSSFSG